MTPRTVARRLSALRQFYRIAVAEGWRLDDPTAALDPPRLGRPLPKVLSESEVQKLLDVAAAMEGPEGKRLTLMLELVYGTGLRVSELVGLPLAAAMRDTRFIIVRGKANKEAHASTPAHALATGMVAGLTYAHLPFQVFRDQDHAIALDLLILDQLDERLEVLARQLTVQISRDDDNVLFPVPGSPRLVPPRERSRRPLVGIGRSSAGA